MITKLTEQWKAEQKAFSVRGLSAVDYVYLRADGIHVNIRLEEHKLCLLIMIGVRADGRKELIALADGYRESAESWADLLRDCARRGMRALVLAAGDGALGFWGALRTARGSFPRPPGSAAGFTKLPMSSRHCRNPRTRARRRLSRRSGMPRTSSTPSPPPGYSKPLDGAKFPKAAAKITSDPGQLLAFYDYPAGHRVHLRTTNPIEPAFRDGPAPDQGHQGPRLAAAGRGVQAHRVSAGPLARRERAPSGRARPRRRPFRRRRARRTARRPRAGRCLAEFWRRWKCRVLRGGGSRSSISNPAWPVLFGELGRTLRAALGAVALRIDHIGSTAVAGLATKPVIDMRISVAAFEPIEAFKDPLEQLGYVYRADNPERTKRYFPKPPAAAGPISTSGALEASPSKYPCCCATICAVTPMPRPSSPP